VGHVLADQDFITSAGFAGLAAVFAAIIVGCAVLYVAWRAAEQRERHHREVLEDEHYSAAVTRCWEQLKWVVNSAGLEPAATDTYVANMGFGPELAEQILQGLLADAEELRDHTLVKAVSAYLNQLGLVLAQQGGSFAQPRPVTRPSAGRQPAKRKPDDKPVMAGDREKPAARPAASKAREGQQR
jgi:hypothetical protein